MNSLLLSVLLSALYAEKPIQSDMQTLFPKGPGSYEGLGHHVNITQNMGLAGYSIPFDLPQGHAKHTPNISLSYQSTHGNGEAGMGWFLTVPYLQRSSRLKQPQYDDLDLFTTEQGRDLKNIPTTNVWREEQESSFTRFHKRSHNSWMAEYADGSKGFYGTLKDTPNTPYAVTDGYKGPHTWHLAQHIDVSGHTVQYGYIQDKNHTYLSSVHWALRKNGSYAYSMHVAYENRPDTLCNNVYGREHCIYQRIASVSIYSYGSLYKKYVFTYTHSLYNDTISLLSNVTLLGSDGHTPDLVSYTFTYPSKKQQSFTYNAGSVSVSHNTSHIHWVDLNADAVPDILDTSSVEDVVYMGQSTGCTHTSYNTPKNINRNNSVDLSSPYSHTVDLNGDGLTDFLDTVNKYTYIHKGLQGWSEKNVVDGFIPNIENNASKVHWMDMNGDKKMDIVEVAESTFWYYEGFGDGSFKQASEPFQLHTNPSMPLATADINGDGLHDFVQTYADGFITFQAYMGYGLFAPIREVWGLPMLDDTSKVHWVDINGDSLDDAVIQQGNTLSVHLNNSGVYFDETPLSTQDGSYLFIPEDAFGMLHFSDINRNGSMDAAWITHNGNIFYADFFNTRPYLMESVSNGVNNTLSFEYSCFTPDNDILTYPLTVLKSYTQDIQSLEKDIRTYTYNYNHPFIDKEHHRFNGFESTTETHNSAMVKTYHHTGQEQDDLRGHVKTLDFYINQQHHKEIRFLYQHCIRKDPSSSVQWTFPCVSSKQKTLFHPIEGSSYTHAKMQYDPYGNITLEEIYPEKTEKKTVETFYITPENMSFVWNIHKPYQKKITYHTDTPKTKTSYMYYDGFETLQKATKGFVTKEYSEEIPVVSYGYDTHGNIVSKKDAEQRERLFVYDEDGLHIFSEKVFTDNKKQPMSSYFAYNLFSNKLVSHEDFKDSDTLKNITKKQWSYDTLGRIVSVSYFPDTPENPTESYTYSLQNGFLRILTHKKTSPNTYENHVQCIDGNGQLSQTFIEAEKGVFQNTLSQSHTEYGVFKEWVPHLSSGECGTIPKNTPFFSERTYDPFGRISLYNLFNNNSTSTHTWEYGLQSVIHRHPSGYAQKTTYDGLERTQHIDIIENPKKPVRYSYGYDGYGCMNTFTNPISMTSTQENSSSCDALNTYTHHTGKTSRVFDQTGLLLKTTDQNENSVSYMYDSAGRVLRQTESGIHPSTTYLYENNRLSSFEFDIKNTHKTYAKNNEYFTYDARGNIVETVIKNNGYTVVLSYTYDNLSRLQETSVFNKTIEKRTYDRLGRIKSIEPWIKEIRYNPQNNASSIHYNNGFTSHHTYDLLQNITSMHIEDPNQKTVKYFYWSYDKNGNITEKKESDQKISRYTYDFLNRLSSYTNEREDVFYAYDAFGNITQKTSSLSNQSNAHTGYYTYHPKTNLLSQAGSWDIAHSSTGDITSIDNVQFTWDTQHRLVKASNLSSQNHTQWFYHPSKRISYRHEDGHLQHHLTSTIMIDDGILKIHGFLNGISVGFSEIPLEQEPFLYDLKNIQNFYSATQNEEETRIKLSQRSAHLLYTQKNPPYIYYVFSDAHKNPVLSTDTQGRIVGEKWYYPHGENMEHKGYMGLTSFSSVYKDKTWPLSIHSERFLSGSIGRFVSSDMYFEQLSSRHIERFLDTNTYAYSVNNPLMYEDITGKYSVRNTFLFSQNVHGRAIERVFHNILPPNIIETLVQAQTEADEDQRNEVQFRHAMRTDHQTPAEAAALSDNYIRTTLREAHENPNDNMRLLGFAIHTLQDSTSPTHTGFQYWGEETSIGDMGAHISPERRYPEGMNRVLLEAATHWGWDLYTGAASMPKNFFGTEGQGFRLLIPQRYIDMHTPRQR